MPPFKKTSKTHSDFLKLICAACWRKKPSVTKVSDKLSQLICQHIFAEYSVDSDIHPSVICDGCRKTLMDIDKVCFF